MLGAGLEVLLTVDQNLRYQQNLSASSISVVVLIAKSNRLPDLLPLAETVRIALLTLPPGSIVEIDR